METHVLPTSTQSKKDKSFFAINRSRRRGIRHGAGGMLSRFRSGIGTGQTPHFKMWKADLNIRAALQGTTLASLADRHDDANLATAYRLILKHGYFKTVWDLTQATPAQLHDTPGLGPKRIAAVKADLAKHQVMVNW